MGVGVITAQLPWGEGDLTGILIFAVILVYLWGAHLFPAPWRSDRSLWLVSRNIILLAFLLRATVAIFHRLYPILPELYTLDAETYDWEGWAIADAWLTGNNQKAEFISLSAAIHEHFIAVVYFLIGHSVLSIKILSSFVGTLSIYYLFLFAVETVGKKRALLVTFLVTVWPSHVLWTSHNFRDPWVFYFLSRVIYSSLLWLKYDSQKEWLKTALFIVLTGLFRELTGLLLALTFVTVSVYEYSRKATGLLRVSVLFLSAIGAVGFFLIMKDVLFFSHIQDASPLALSQIRQNLAIGGSTSYPDITYNSWFDILFFAPSGIVYFLFAPFPWQITNAVQLASSIENFALYFLTALACFRFSFLCALVRKEILFVGLFLVCGVVASGVVEGNVGTAYRHKMQFLPYLLVLLSPAWPLFSRVKPQVLEAKSLSG